MTDGYQTRVCTILLLIAGLLQAAEGFGTCRQAPTAQSHFCGLPYTLSNFQGTLEGHHLHEIVGSAGIAVFSGLCGLSARLFRHQDCAPQSLMEQVMTAARHSRSRKAIRRAVLEGGAPIWRGVVRPSRALDLRAATIFARRVLRLQQEYTSWAAHFNG